MTMWYPDWRVPMPSPRDSDRDRGVGDSWPDDRPDKLVPACAEPAGVFGLR